MSPEEMFGDGNPRYRFQRDERGNTQLYPVKDKPAPEPRRHAYVIPRDEDGERGPELFIQVGNDGSPLNVPVNRGQMAAILLWAARHLAKWGKA